MTPEAISRLSDGNSTQKGSRTLACSIPLGFVVVGIALLAWRFLVGDSVAKTVLQDIDHWQPGLNLLESDNWQPSGEGYETKDGQFVCDNGKQTGMQRGVVQTVELNQVVPHPIGLEAWSRAENVSGILDGDYTVQMNLIYDDGTGWYALNGPFATGTHDWQRGHVRVNPSKPVKRVELSLRFCNHSGKAVFRAPILWELRGPENEGVFDGVQVRVESSSKEGFQIRDVAAGTGFVRVSEEVLGLKLDVQTAQQNEATFCDVSVSDTSGKDRAITLVYSIPVPREELEWLDDPRRAYPVASRVECVNASRFAGVGQGRLSRYPFAAVSNGKKGWALGIDLQYPEFYRVGYSALSGELYLAYDLGLAREKPTAHVRFCKFQFEPKSHFRSALARYYEIFPDAFVCRVQQQGLWMAATQISQVKNWRDFGFRFKECANETKWDDEHDVLTFRYTQPTTWWMPMPPDAPRTRTAALALAKRLSAGNGDAAVMSHLSLDGTAQARALSTSAFHDEDGEYPVKVLDRPWCDGAVWSMNCAPMIPGDHTQFNSRWNPDVRARYYGEERQGDLDGEYVDSGEGYITDCLNYRRDHFSVSHTPLCFSTKGHRVALFKGLVIAEYVRALAHDVRGMGKLMMANGTPSRISWLVPWLDVMGTETTWIRHGRWEPMSDSEFLYRRAMCGQKPFCFLMNTRFEDLSHTLVEKYMKRTLAYGMFPGFFSANSCDDRYFTRPELYERDRPLFKKYVPLCRIVAEAGWEPLTDARASDRKVYVERFGSDYLTLFNDSQQSRDFVLELHGPAPPSCSHELVSGETVVWQDGKVSMTLDAEDVAVLHHQWSDAVER